jgi:hypothetical protein
MGTIYLLYFKGDLLHKVCAFVLKLFALCALAVEPESLASGQSVANIYQLQH